VISFQQSGAGGYGVPLARDPARVLDDVLDDYVSIEAARDRYGVVITGSGADLTVDEGATRDLRRQVPSLSAHPRSEPGSPTPLRRQLPSLSAHPRSEPGSPTPLQ